MSIEKIGGALSEEIGHKSIEQETTKLVLENGEVLVGDVIYSFPNDFSREDEISFDGIIEASNGEKKYERLVALFFNNKGYSKKDAVVWKTGVWDKTLKCKVKDALEKIVPSLGSHESRQNGQRLIEKLQAEIA